MNSFIIRPITCLGRVVNSYDIVPEKITVSIKFNPYFYFIDGIRYSMIIIRESNLTFDVGMILVLIVVLSLTVGYLFHKGWKLRF